MADTSGAAAQNVPQQGYAAPVTGTMGRTTRPGRQILLTIVTLGIWAIVWSYRQFEDIKLWSGEGLGGALGAVITVFVGIVTPFLLANEVQTHLYERSGEHSPVETITGVWSLIPLVGGLIWYLKVQEAINDFWVSKGAEAPA